MNRREFLAAGAVAGISPMLSAACPERCGCAALSRLAPPPRPAKLNLCLQWGGIPAADDVNAKLDFLEANGYQAVELPSGIDWLRTKGLEVAAQMKNRKLFISTACGPSRFDYADPAKNDAEVAKFMPVLELLGEIKSTGLIICPARGKPEVGLTELRADFVANTGRRIAEKAAACGTTIVLEPLQRKETPFMRQVADATKIAQEIGKGCTVLGDFWHMRWEEPSFFAAFVAAGQLLAHVHIASLERRKIPGSDGAADNYVDGFKGLKFIGYQGAVSVEAGFVPKGKDAKGKPILPDLAERTAILAKMSAMLRRQWEEA